MESLNLPPIQKIHADFKAGTARPSELVEQCLAHIAANNPKVNAFVVVDEAGAREAAQKADARFKASASLGLLDGIPFTVKDVLDVKNYPTLKGSNLSDANKLADKDCPAVARLREAGGIFIGKTTTCEFGHKGTADSLRHGLTLNPHNPDKTSGGSSGGAAVAAAMNMGVLHLANDGGGSIRIPANFCGVAGFKPSYGLVPETSSPYGLVRLTQTGIITRHVQDLWLGMHAIAQNRCEDANALPFGASLFAQTLDMAKKFKIAYAPTMNGFEVNPSVASIVRQAVEKMPTIGHSVTEIQINEPELLDCIGLLWMYDAWASTRQFSESDIEKMDPSLQKWLEWAKDLDMDKITMAAEKRAEIALRFDKLFAQYDLVIMPTLPIGAFKAGLNGPEEKDRMNLGVWWTPFTAIANLAGLPALNLPCGFDIGGLRAPAIPVGMQIMAGRFQDKKIFDCALGFMRVHQQRGINT